MQKKYISIIFIIFIITMAGGYFVLQTSRGKILQYEIEEWKDEVVYEMENDDAIVEADNLEIEDGQEVEVVGVKKVVNTEYEEVEIDSSDMSQVEKNNFVKVGTSTTFAKANELSDQFLLPTEFKFDVKFSAQAPHGNWDAPYQEACEESSIIMAAKYLKNENLNADIMDSEIKKLVDWEMKNFGYYEHTNAQEVATIVEEYFDLSSEIIENPSIEDLKKELFAGKLILIPAAGRELGNPYYTAPGPIYHMLVLVGWRGERWITNDPGTRHGESFTYPFESFMSAIHDCPALGEEEVTQEMIMTGGMRVIVVDR